MHACTLPTAVLLYVVVVVAVAAVVRLQAYPSVQIGGASTSPSVNGAVRAAAVGGGGAPTTVLLLRRLPSVVGDAVPNPQPHQLPRLRRAFGCDWLFFFGSDDVSGGGSPRWFC